MDNSKKRTMPHGRASRITRAIEITARRADHCNTNAERRATKRAAPGPESAGELGEGALGFC
jgi:hypothetical protein